MDRAQSINLTWADIDFERGRIHVRNRAATPELPPFTVKADGRGGPSKARSVPIPKPVADALAAWQADTSEGVPFVFMTAERFEQVKRNWTRWSSVTCKAKPFWTISASTHRRWA